MVVVEVMEEAMVVVDMEGMVVEVMEDDMVVVDVGEVASRKLKPSPTTRD